MRRAALLKAFAGPGLAMGLAAMVIAAEGVDRPRRSESWWEAFTWKPTLDDWNPLRKPALYCALALAATVGFARFARSAGAWRSEKSRVRSALLSVIGPAATEREARRHILALVSARNDDHTDENVWLAFLPDRIVSISPQGRTASIGLSDITRLDLVEMGVDFGIVIEGGRDRASRRWRVRLGGISDMVKIVNILKKHGIPAGHRKA